MNILAIGDIVGDVGTEMFTDHIDALKKKYAIDFCIVNGENACANNGITRRKAEALLSAGADVLTMGNHTFRQREAFDLLANNEQIVRPLNFPPGTPGRGYATFTKNGKKIAVVNLLGRVYMDAVDCPFRAVDKALEKINADFVFVDFHAEATSEKISMGWHLDGRVTGMFGTHTHVQTADGWVLPKGTGYITDIGMTGPQYSCLGVKREITLERFITGMPRRFEFADGKGMLSGCVFRVNDETKKTEQVEAFCIR